MYTLTYVVFCSDYKYVYDYAVHVLSCAEAEVIVVGVVAAVSIALLTAALLVCALVCVVRQRKAKK